jgi:hypothetical protein
VNFDWTAKPDTRSGIEWSGKCKVESTQSA